MRWPRAKRTLPAMPRTSRSNWGANCGSIRRRTGSPETIRPTGCARARCGSRGGYRKERTMQASRQKPVAAQMMKDEKYGGAAQIMALPVSKLVAVLEDPGASVYAKAKACQRLAVVGDKTAVPALAALLPNPQLSHYARIALE